MILKTKDYSIFKKHESNREIDNSNLKKIVSSIKFKNLLTIRPIIVNKDMEVIDGQHRLKAAEMLSLEIFYTINEKSESNDIILLNNNQKRWFLVDYINYYRSQGIKDYEKINDFMKELGIEKEDIFINLVFYRGGHSFHQLKAGTLKFPYAQEENIRIRWRYILEIKNILRSSLLIKKIKFIETTRFLKAMVDLSNKEFFDFEYFIKKISGKLDAIHPCSTSEGYVEMFKAIYNWRAVKPIE